MAGYHLVPLARPPQYRTLLHADQAALYSVRRPYSDMKAPMPESEHTARRRLVAETICNNINVSFYRWGHLSPEAHAIIMKTASAVIEALTGRASNPT